jgi:hypothetical protein
MNAEVAPREELAAGAPDNEVFAEYPGRDGATIGKLFDTRYGMPILDEDGVIDHRYSGQ